VDARNKLFSLNGESPSFLPSRVRLPNGLTRYIQDISTEELASLGYTGPYEPPVDSATEYFTWDKISLSFVSNTRTSFVSLQESREVKAAAKKLLDNLELPQGATSEYADSFSSSVSSLRSIVSSDSLVSFSDLPALPDTQYKTRAALQELADNFFAAVSGNWQRTYALNGVLKPEPDPLFAEFVNVPSDWVVTNEEPPAYPSGYIAGEDSYYDGIQWVGGSFQTYEVGDQS
jgi:hypothetical protein